MSFRLSFQKVRRLLIICIFCLSLFSGGYFLGFNGYKAKVDKSLRVQFSRSVPPGKNVDFSLFWQVWDTLSANYYDKSKLVPSDMVYGAISGMVSSLGDPYTLFLTPDENKIENEDLSGSLEGVGIEIGYRNSNIVVIAPITGSPAEKAGIKAGDYIVHIKDEKKNVDIDSTGLSVPQAVSIIRGQAGSKVTLTLVRDGTKDPIVKDLIREKLNIPSVVLSWEGDNKDIARLKVTKFSSDTVAEWNTATTKIKENPSTRGIILDLRNDPGGYLQAAISLASDFVKQSDNVVTVVDGSGSKKDNKGEKSPSLANYKVVILINGGSASASEILAGALRDDRGFKLVGDKSFGKGTVQDPLEIPGGSGLHVTTAKWLTPNGTWVHGKGLDPDIKVKDDENTAQDEQLEAALKLFK